MDKSLDLMKRMGMITESKNFLSEIRNNLSNNAEMVSINENNARRLLDKHTKDGYVVISPCRGFDDFGIDRDTPNANELLTRANKPRIEALIKAIKDSGFSYTPVYGGFIENLGTENEQNVYERSFIVYPYNKKGELINFENLQKFAIKMCNIFNQDSVLIHAPNQKPTYVNRNGDVEFELGDKRTFNDYTQEYFTDLHKNTQGKKAKRATRFSYTESYFNPAPQTLNESFIRKANNEIALPYR